VSRQVQAAADLIGAVLDINHLAATQQQQQRQVYENWETSKVDN
jgi:hypothetical protein